MVNTLPTSVFGPKITPVANVGSVAIVTLKFVAPDPPSQLKVIAEHVLLVVDNVVMVGTELVAKIDMPVVAVQLPDVVDTEYTHVPDAGVIVGLEQLVHDKPVAPEIPVHANDADGTAPPGLVPLTVTASPPPPHVDAAVPGLIAIADGPAITVCVVVALHPPLLYVIVEKPAFTVTGLTRPVSASTVATDVLELVQVPPEGEPINAEVSDGQIGVVPPVIPGVGVVVTLPVA